MDNKPQQLDNLNLPQPISDVQQQATPITNQAVEQTQPLQVAPPMPQVPGAKDADVIEIAWIKAVQSLQRQYADDPKRFSDEFSKLKARYIKERYNTDIKTSQAEGPSL